ncbi:MAG: twin transmembrane helix small protein [Neomegalonema sp.]|nr:twin transmembrane helix small protein [Neomegalonema sp.]
MSNFLLFLLPVVLVGVLGSLALGLKSLAGEADEDRRRSNRMMQWRVGLQALAVVILMALLALGS